MSTFHYHAYIKDIITLMLFQIRIKGDIQSLNTEL
mgnify:CR=1 FL=1